MHCAVIRMSDFGKVECFKRVLYRDGQVSCVCLCNCCSVEAHAFAFYSEYKSIILFICENKWKKDKLSVLQCSWWQKSTVLPKRPVSNYWLYVCFIPCGLQLFSALLKHLLSLETRSCISSEPHRLKMPWIYCLGQNIPFQ